MALEKIVQKFVKRNSSAFSVTCTTEFYSYSTEY